jgi:ribosomal protein S27E
MSRFQTGEVSCPSCGRALSFQTAYSVNADRRPDLREAMLAGTFQRIDCPHCTARLRLDPDFNVLDIARGQWIAAAPVAGIAQWKAREDAARALFERAYGTEASDMAQAIGKKLKPRITFGWPALREKLLAAAHGLDDIALEACKAAVMRGVKGLPVSAVSALRLADVNGDRLVMAWLRSYDGAEGEAVNVPRSLHDKVLADVDGAWAGFRRDFDGALFVDLNRMLLPPLPAAA